MNCDEISSVPDWIIEYPQTAAVFAELHIDTSCGGKSLEYVCESQRLDAVSVLERLRQAVMAGERRDNETADGDPELDT